MNTDTEYSPQKRAYINIESLLRPFSGRKGKTLLALAESTNGTEHHRLGFARLDRGVVRMMSKDQWASRFPDKERCDGVTNFEVYAKVLMVEVARAAATKVDWAATPDHKVLVTLLNPDHTIVTKEAFANE